MVKRGLRNAATKAVVGLVVTLGCKPDVEGRASLVDSDRVLAIRSTPAEVDPSVRAPVHYEALYVGKTSDPDPGALDWAFCTESKPLAVTGPIAPSCLALTAPSLTPLGTGVGADGTVPKDACSVFGPDPPKVEAGKPASRPADPDTTGGYYQPVRLAVTTSQNEFAVGVTRLDCGLSAATQQQSIEYRKKHRPNENPALDTLSLVTGSGTTPVPLDGTATPFAAARGESLSLHATWAACPASPVCGDGMCTLGETDTSCAGDCAPPTGCTGAGCVVRGCPGSELYQVLDPNTHVLLQRREAIRVFWYATQGDFDHDRTGRSEAEAGSADTENQWVAPDAAGPVRMWIVVRDDRGGVGWSALTVDVR